MSQGRIDWEGAAMSRLTRVLGERAGREMAASVKEEIAIPQLQSAGDLRTFADALQRRGGFAGAVGGLLHLHATMHDDGSVAP